MLWMAIMLQWLLTLVLPLLAVLWLWFGSVSSKAGWWSKTLVVGGFLLYLFWAIGWWYTVSYFLRFLLPLLYLGAAAFSFCKTKEVPWLVKKDSIGNLIRILACLFFVYMSAGIVRGLVCSEETMELAFPLRDGLYCVAHGGSNTGLNYHYVDRTQRYALDIVKLNRYGARAEGFFPTRLEAYAIFGDIVFSPCDGKVVLVENDRPDLVPPERDTEHPAGNFVLIETDEVNIMLAHLQEGSITVSEGDRVWAGQAIGRVGNSGSSSEPHLHIHAEKEGEGVPLTFKGRFPVRNSLFFR